ncbi:hypothetical protein SprV_0702413700 [Sparganum proliferum]
MQIRTCLPLQNASELCERLVWDEEEAFDARTLSSAIKRYLSALPVSLLNANMFASFVASTANETASERGGRSLRTPAGLASALCQLRVALMKAFGCPGKATALDLERGWRLATLDYVMRHFREVVALQAINRMSPRALALCLAPSLFGSTDDAEINSQVLELLIEHWPWLSECLLHRGSQPVSADRLGEPLSDACLYACRQRPPAPSKQLPSCYRCGQHHIRWSDCRHQKTVCQFCKKIGHIERVCFSKRRATYSNPAGDGEAILRMFSANALLQSPYTITLPVDRHPVKFEIDTGSAVILINEASLQKLPSLLPASSTFRCPQSDSPGPVFGGRLTQQAEAPDRSGVPRLLVEMVKALRRRGLCMEGIYRVPGRASRVQEIIQLANSNASELCNRLVWDEEVFDARALLSAIKRYLSALPVSLLNANMFASFVASTAMERASERGGRSLRTPAGLASVLCRLRVALMKAFGCPGKATALDLERGWRVATLDNVMRHFREVVALQAINRMSPRALALCLAPSLFGSTQDAETNSQVLELLIEHWPWLSECLLHRGSQPVSAERLGEPLSDACLYACRYQRHCFLQSLCLPPTLPPSPPPLPPPPSVDGVCAGACT